jgi:hypothetical protein
MAEMEDDDELEGGYDLRTIMSVRARRNEPTETGIRLPRTSNIEHRFRFSIVLVLEPSNS